ncbi:MULTISPECIES: allophanate hydrolase subunit 1 [unclassified Rhodococcus (in: high G+C Gram-positive bacteria)]|uniref:5-oxoprolinase subunit B family protein n=1 Tax=unclassified Rhodococcus (in: high G+C Gram-positive bacteria) TaxID=192944 RepID=UPI00211AD0F9|nr:MULTISPECIES: allophanate hydrolase subunit 1 [unclassified Rhodococcus (in: high G+C Gram-positive bacteria)]
MRPAGSHALLLEPADHTSVDALTHLLRRSPVDGVTDVLPAAQTVLITTDSRSDLGEVERRLHELFADFEPTSHVEDAEVEAIRIPVVYSGGDLGEVARILGISTDDVIAEHTRRTWRCSFVGFAPGFGYLASSEPGLAVPRREESRTAVPAGSVALADGYSAVYPRRSPGGWQLIGRTSVSTWDTHNPQPALITPGCSVQFVAEDIR